MNATFSQIEIEPYKLPDDLKKYFEPALCGKCYVCRMVEVFRQVRRVLRDDGTVWLNLGDSYGGPKGNTAMTGGKSDPERGDRMYGDIGKKAYGTSKQLLGVPWRVAFALQADGWWLRQDIIWHKTAPMPESVTDRCTKAHEYLFLLAKSQHYYFDADAIREPHKREWDSNNGGSMAKTHLAAAAVNGQGHQGWNHKGDYPLPNPAGANRRSVWTLGPESYSGAHFATMPTKLVEPCVLAGSKVGDTVLDPFSGSGTVGAVALKHGRKYIGIDLNAEYNSLAHKRISESQPLLFSTI